MTYKLNVSDRNYQEWCVYDSLTLKKTKIPIDPAREKLFNQDIFSLNGKNECSILHSMTRQMKSIQGVLVLENNKTYGKWKRDKFLYRCIPDDRRLPIFLIPYKIKLLFEKKQVNKYITFTFKQWDSKHPYGTIFQIIGDVDNLCNFYEYQLYCKSLYASIQQFNKAAMKSLRAKSGIQSIIETYKLEDRSDKNIYSIDPSKSGDLDDAWGYSEIDNNIVLSIYIANVSLWLDSMNLWGSFSKRIATIYLPDRKRPMLPTVLSDALCSLQEDQVRFAFTLDVIFDKDTYKIKETKYCNSQICVKKNFRYDSDELKQNPDYIHLFKIVQTLNEHHKYTRTIKDSHDVIAYMMILMNYISGKKLLEYKTGIFRSVKLNEQISLPEYLPENFTKFIKFWNSSGGQYVLFNDYRSHDVLDLDAYVHITSPIRRLVDLLNIMELQDKLGLLQMNESMRLFFNEWVSKLDYINKTMRSIRKVQNDCSLLHYCVTKGENEISNGFIFDKIMRNDGLYQYMVYFPSLKMVNRFTTRHDHANYSKHQFRIFVFMDEDRLKQKLRIDLFKNV